MASATTNETESKKRRIFIVDDHPLVREWLATLINQQTDLTVSGEAGAVAEGLGLIGAQKPDIAIVDISLEGGSGIELIKEIKAAFPEVAIIVLTMHDEVLYRERAFRAGARGYVMKREATKTILQAIRAVLEGKTYVSQKRADAAVGEAGEQKAFSKAPPVELLSDRELEVFQSLGRGSSTRQIAEELHIGFRTVQTYCARIKEKLGLARATELLREALRWHDSQGLK